jgi:hypothetical protein
LLDPFFVYGIVKEVKWYLMFLSLMKLQGSGKMFTKYK